MKSFCITKQTVRKVRRQLSEWEKMIENEAMDKEFNLQNIKATLAAQFQKHTTQSKSGP